MIASALHDRAEAASARYAVAALVRMVMPMLQAFDSRALVELEKLVSALSRPPLASGAKWLGQFLRDRTPEQIKELFEETIDVAGEEVPEEPETRTRCSACATIRNPMPSSPGVWAWNPPRSPVP
jgi:hypothetical protein